MSSRRPEGNTKVVFTSWKSLWDTIRETELTEDERALVENTSVAGFVRSQNARTANVLPTASAIVSELAAAATAI